MELNVTFALLKTATTRLTYMLNTGKRKLSLICPQAK